MAQGKLLIKKAKNQMYRFTQQEYDRLIDNAKNDTPEEFLYPVMRLRFFRTKCNFLICFLTGDNDDTAFALCDWGMGDVGLGYIKLDVLRAYQTKEMLLLKDLSFEGSYPLNVYFHAAQKAGHITVDPKKLRIADYEMGR
ncbi:DUF2958 domain-containing protein [Mucilaginibacter pedocola]|uniref:Uncharacterized protein n=1 Tax=Mucilaginibacter pedocola TaxID=1792845 RepID=A0A1S9P8V4_9SPHI|nr:DUF2958 domain-containing protein [Mucilaginibacter pedocola]OOQ57372.1 hypothetical protein BC343_14825 [Mucilaginibacter pedocola]